MGRVVGRDGGGAADDAADPSRRGASESAGVRRVGGGVGGGVVAAAGVAAVPPQPRCCSWRSHFACSASAGLRRRASPRPPGATLVTDSDVAGRAAGSVEDVEGEPTGIFPRIDRIFTQQR